MKKNYFLLKVLLFICIFSAGIIYPQTFTKVTTGSFVNDGGASRSVNFIDYDGDGDLDLYVSNGKRFGQRSFLYQNNAGNFTRIFNTGPVNDSLPFDGSSWGDFDNDGNIDMCTVTWYDSISVLYKNNGSGSFTFLGNSPIVTDRGFSETCSWGDFDNDGLIDILVTNSRPANSRNRLYKNLGAGDFARVDSGAIFLDVGILSRGVNWIDIDNDRDQDLFVCNEEGANEFIYKNEGSGYFTKVLNISPTTSGGNSWSSSWGDYDNDSDFDLFVANWGNQQNFMFKNEGSFNFTRITNDTIVNQIGNFACSGWGDYDNDGDLDMFVTQAYITPNSPLNNILYKSLLMETNSPTFERITSGDIVNDPGYAYGFAWADWDADGDLDLFTARTYNENQNNAAYLNNGNSNKWIEFKLRGTTTNKSAIGTKLRIKALINGNPVWQVREVSGQSGYCGQNLDLHFGLGNASVIDSVRIEWQSGLTEHYTNISVNQIITVTEGVPIGIYQKGTEIPHGYKLYQNYPNPFNPVTSIKFDISNMSNGFNDNVQLKIYDALGKQIKILVNQQIKPGSYEIEWDASNHPSGVYFYELSFGVYKESKKMIVAK